MSFVENAKAFGRGAKEGIQEFWHDYKPVIIGWGAVCAGALIYSYGWDKGRQHGWLEGFDAGNTVIATTLKNHAPDLFEQADDVINKHGLDTMKELCGKK